MELTFQEGLTYLAEAGSPVLGRGFTGLVIAASRPVAAGDRCSFHMACAFLLPIAVHDAFHRVSQAINVFVEDPFTGQGHGITCCDPEDEPSPGVGLNFIGQAGASSSGQLRGGWVNGTLAFDLPLRAAPRRIFVRASLFSYLSNAVMLDFDASGAIVL